MESEDIINAIPENFLKIIKELGILDKYVAEVQNCYPHLSLSPKISLIEHYRSFASLEHTNFASFMWESWFWNMGIKKFSWWFRVVFGYNFIHDPLTHTSKIVAEAIKNYQLEDSFEIQSGGLDDNYSSKQSFYDAYGDGFSDYEDSKYFSNNDVDEY